MRFWCPVKKHLAGAACLGDCIHVADRVDGQLKATRPDLDLALPANLEKHRIPLERLGIIKYSKVYAWVLESPQRFASPVPYHAKKGTIGWSKFAIIQEPTPRPYLDKDVP